MRKNKSKKKAIIAILLILMLVISVGYAALSTTLTINGSATVKKRNWNIYFDNIVEKKGSITATTEPTMNEDRTEVTWGVSMEKPGEFYEFTVDAVNAGDIDAMIGNLSNTLLTETQQKYLNYTLTYANGGEISQYDELKAGETVGIKVRLEFRTDINVEDLPTEAEEITLTYTSEYVQADENAKGRNTYKIEYNLNEGTEVTSNPTTYSIETESITLNNPSKTGYTFTGWSGTDLEGNENITVTIEKGSTGDKSYTANWRANTYEIVFNANNGTGTMQNQVMTYDTVANLQANSYTRTGCIFSKWNTEPDGTGINYENEEEVRNLATSGTVNLYAIWKVNIGETINYTTTLNEVKLTDWKIFYGEGEYVYLKYGDYLPNAAVNIAGIEKNSTYSVYTNIDRATLLKAMTTKSNYDSLLQGTINGKAVNETRTEEVWAMGSPTLDLWVKSWNTSYPSDKLYISGDETTGYKIGETENPTSTKVNITSKEGYNNTLYFPHKEKVDNCCGIWTASPSVTLVRTLMCVNYDGYVLDGSYYSVYEAFCPIVRLPSNILE